MQRKASSVLVCVAAILAAGDALLWRWVDFAIPAELNPMLFGMPLVLELTQSATVSRVLIAVGVIGALSYSLLGLLLWSRARRQGGSAILVAAAILGLIPIVAQLSALTVYRLGGGVPVTLLAGVESIAASFGWLVQPVALFALSLGVYRAKIAPAWIAAAGVAAAVVLASSLPGGGPLDLYLPSALSGNRSSYLVGVAIETAFLISTGLTVVYEAHRPVPIAG